MPRGICKLCLKTKKLTKSHFMPAALYSKKASSAYATRTNIGPSNREIKAWLLCCDCEQLFNENGESEVLRYTNPKGPRFPLHEMLKVGLPREYHPDLSRFSGADFGVDMDKFAYFAISVAWRGAVHDWIMPDGTVDDRYELGEFVEPMRVYLLGKAPSAGYCRDVVVSTDDEARRVWITPATHVEMNCLNVRFLTFGVFFRVMMGYGMPQFFRNHCCTSPRKCLFSGSDKHRMPEIMRLFERAAPAQASNLSSTSKE